MTPLCIVPARSQSKRIPNKNFRALCGLSPMRWAIRCCKLGLPQADIVVTSDACLTGVRDNVQWHQRPFELATDDASMVDVVVDVLRAYPGDPSQPCLLVQPTQPLRRPEHLQRALHALETTQSVASVVLTEPVEKLYWVYGDVLSPVAEALGTTGMVPLERAQDCQPTFRCDGTVYGFTREYFLHTKQFRTPLETRALLIPSDESCPLDTPTDWLIASLLMAHHAQ